MTILVLLNFEFRNNYLYQFIGALLPLLNLHFAMMLASEPAFPNYFLVITGSANAAYMTKLILGSYGMQTFRLF